MTGSLIVHADDLGLSRAFNAGILDAAQAGVLTSTCIRVNGGALDEAIAQVLPQCPDLGVGLHLNVVEGRTTRVNVPRGSALCAADGSYRPGFAGLVARQRQRSFMDEVERDFRDQIERALSLRSRIDHLNSHQHSHAVPALFRMTCRLAIEYGIPFVRLPRERWHAAGSVLRHLRPWYPVNVAKHMLLNTLSRWNEATARGHAVRTNDWLVGIAYTGHVRMETVLAGLHAVADGGAAAPVVEVLVHPCRMGVDHDERYIAPAVREYVHHPDRVRETELLTDPRLRDALLSRGWTLTCYGCLASGDGSLHAHCSPPHAVHRSAVSARA